MRKRSKAFDYKQSVVFVLVRTIEIAKSRLRTHWYLLPGEVQFDNSTLSPGGSLT
jgi:hypothetical protein